MRSCSRALNSARDDLHPEKQRGEGGNCPERAEGERFRAERLLGLGLQLRRDLEVGEVLLRRVPPALDGRHVRRATPKLRAQIDECLGVGRQQAGERRRADDVGREARDLVLHDLPVQQPDADDLERHATRLYALTGLDREGNVLTHVQAQGCRRCLRDHNLISTGGIRHPPAGHGETVLVEEEPVDAAHEEDVAVESSPLRLPRSSQRRGQRLVALHVRDLRVLAHSILESLRQMRLTHTRTTAGRHDCQVRGVGRRQEDGERRGGPSGRRDGAEGDAAGQADEHDEHQIARALPLPTDDRPVPGSVDRRGRLHRPSLHDRGQDANGVSRCGSLVVPRPPRTGGWASLRSARGCCRQWFERLHRHPAGALGLTALGHLAQCRLRHVVVHLHDLVLRRAIELVRAEAPHG